MKTKKKKTRKLDAHEEITERILYNKELRNFYIHSHLADMALIESDENLKKYPKKYGEGLKELGRLYHLAADNIYGAVIFLRTTNELLKIIEEKLGKIPDIHHLKEYKSRTKELIKDINSITRYVM